MSAATQKDWFVVHTLTGQEGKARESILKRLKAEELEELIEDVVIPTEKVSEVKRGVRTTTTRKFFPGYVLIKMDLYNDQRELSEKIWHYVRDTPGVIGFIGGEKPVPLRAEEVDGLMNQMHEKQEKVKPKVQFEPGETVKINDGPFLNFNGSVEEVDPERGKLKVSVAIFGRSAPVELEYWQVERVD
ncbi:MAG: transcription termination/antitermination protein NusG [Verrucomicrobia bacterium]|nr:transcription termination/antitermination protein NusG [Verrucomicrobiota bacterium]MDA1085758.1 transcription termination/antitermination protein NusG [Verrucomicrobiota bacterium]